MLRVVGGLIDAATELAKGMPETMRLVAGTAVVALAFVGTPSVPVPV
jgi:hypothetical protein